jgi:micrococcal nuclease
MYEYKATLIRVVDGDTVWLRVDLGFRLFAEMDFRILGINAPERHGINAKPEVAERSRQYLEHLLAPNAAGPQVLTIKTSKPDKYGRWLAQIFCDNGVDVGAVMLSTGNAVEYK